MTTAPATKGFNPAQIAHLEADLDKRHVKSRAQSGRGLSYVEGWHVIAEANRIIGFDRWNTETVELRQVAEMPRKIGKHPNQRDGWGVSYVARVRVSVSDPTGAIYIIREGTGAGHGIDADLGLAHESAIKEAETDARKRALMTFGNPFGLALYDKAQENVSANADADLPDLKAGTAVAALDAGKTAAEAKEDIREAQAQGKPPASTPPAGDDVDTFPADRKAPPSHVTQPQARRPAPQSARNAGPRMHLKPDKDGPNSWQERERVTRSSATAEKLLNGYPDLRGLRAMYGSLQQDPDEIHVGLIAQEFEHWEERFRQMRSALTVKADMDSVTKGAAMLRAQLEKYGAFTEPGAGEPDGELPAERDLRTSYSTKAA